MVDLVGEIGSGDLRRSLVAIRDALAVQLSESEPRSAASIATRLQAVVERLTELGTDVEVSESDEIARRRAARRSTA